MGTLRYGFERRLAGTTTLRKELDVDFRPYVILGVCNPNLTYRALTVEPQIGLLPPCSVVVREAPEGGVVVSMADPRAMFTLVDNAAVSPVAAEAEERLRGVIYAVGGKQTV